MSEWSFIRTIIKQAKQNKKDIPSFRKTLAKDIKDEKAFRKNAGKEFNNRYNSPNADLMGEDVYEPITEGRNSRAYINNRIENFKDDDDLEKGYLKYLNRTKQ
ncbi:MAG: hypothetical protein IKH36_02030 [Bacilli bacterium]|nr:hypothetical protein [Bacilli bacterium]